MRCDELQGILSPYLDGELELDQSSSIENHLAACFACERRLDSLRTIKHQIARLPSREEPPVAVRSRIESLRFERPARLRWAAFVALPLLLAALYGWRVREERRLIAFLVADHFRSSPSSVRPAIAEATAEEVERLFSGQIPFDPVVPAISGSRLLGARLCEIDGQKAELLFYDVAGDTVSVFIAPHRGRGRPIRCHRRDEANVCSAVEKPFAVHAVGALPPAHLARIAMEAIPRR